MYETVEELDIMLSIDSSHRKAKKPKLYKDAMKKLWKDVLSVPVNQIPHKKTLKYMFISMLRKAGVLKYMINILKKQ